MALIAARGVRSLAREAWQQRALELAADRHLLIYAQASEPDAHARQQPSVSYTVVRRGRCGGGQ
jgi:hypothetical protein